MDVVRVRRVFKRYMIPILESNGYKLTTSENQGYLFENTSNSKLRITYQFHREYTGTYEVNVIISRGDERGWPYIGLTCFLEDPMFPDSTILNGNWYFDTEDDLVGTLEEQARLFSEKAFNWLNRNEDVDIRKIAQERAAKRAEIHYAGTPEEKEKQIEELRLNLEEWEKRRVKPKLWNE